MENLEKAIAEIKEKMPELELRENEVMCRHCSFKIGGPARAYAVPKDEEELEKICGYLHEHHTAPMILGNGSNILFPDEGLKDLFIISTDKLTELRLEGDGSIYAGAGVSLAKLASFAQQNGLAGLEFASGIPGSLGGGCIMNAGAYGGELKQCVEGVKCYKLKEQKLVTLSNEECRFEYRDSLFKQSGDYVVVAVRLRLQNGSREEIAKRIRELNEKRREKQPLDMPSAGSAFKRPEGNFAAALIDEAGLKGFSVGGAQVSEKHAGFVVNTGNACSHDVCELLKQVEEKVYETSGVNIEPEVIILPPDYTKEC